ncbi:hypothetical protein [Corallococcus exiguus]|uniref:hypothetical protein n=1 Tax=Corallococcus exiguus TaxID=83462 RepID=UPI001560FF01|nr:hypothetical protein [Corallococcus exiguus]NRD44914.1 hypothetical protein [Corallococcus exiguus]
MSGITVRIDTISVLGLSEDARTQAVQATVQDALRRLAERLAKSPLARSGVQELALERLSLDALPADELLSERGAERLADELYSAVLRRFP